jgi:hypothetical protein
MALRPGDGIVSSMTIRRGYQNISRNFIIGVVGLGPGPSEEMSRLLIPTL